MRFSNKRQREFVILVLLGAIVLGVVVAVSLPESCVSGQIGDSRELRAFRKSGRQDVKRRSLQQRDVRTESPARRDVKHSWAAGSAEIAPKSGVDEQDAVSLIDESAEFAHCNDDSSEKRGVWALKLASEAKDVAEVKRCMKNPQGDKTNTARSMVEFAANRLVANAVSGAGFANPVVLNRAGRGPSGADVVDATGGNSVTAGQEEDPDVSGGGNADENKELSRKDFVREMEDFLKEQQALMEWDEKLNECGTEAGRIALAKSALQSSSDENACNYFSSILISSSDKSAAVKVIVELSANGSEACQKAVQDAYSWITDETWTGPKAAQAWLSARGD